MRSPFVRLACSLLCAAALLFAIPLEPGEAVTYPGELRDTDTIAIAGWEVSVAGDFVAVDLGETTSPELVGVQDRIRRLDLARGGRTVGRLDITLRTLPDEHGIVFATLTSYGGALAAEVALSRTGDEVSVRRYDATAKLDHNVHTGVDVTTGSNGIVEVSEDGAVRATAIVSKQHEYRELRNTTAAGRTSVLRELEAERAGLSAERRTDGFVQLTMPLRANGTVRSQTHVLLGSGKAAADVAQDERLRELACREWRWLDPTGAYAKSSWSVSPWTADGYVRSFTQMRSARAMREYARTGSPFMRAMSLSTLYSLLRLRSPDGLWRTEYTHTWVRKTTGIEAGFVDTRHNEGFSLWMNEAAEKLQLDADDVEYLRTASLVFPNYLLELERRGSYVPVGSGLLFRDYYDGYRDNMGHTSLNHALGEMVLLYEAYRWTGDDRYRATADRILAAVENTGTDWIAPSGDLWYAVQGDRYWGGDYPTVTLLDLEKSQAILEDLYGTRNETIETLARSKMGFLNRASVSVLSADELFEETAPDSQQSPEPVGDASLDGPVGLLEPAAGETAQPSADALDVEDSGVVTGTVDPLTPDRDRVALDLDAGERVLLTLEASPTVDARVSVADGAGTETASSGVGIYPVVTSFEASSAGPYTISVSSLAGSGAYSLRWERLAFDDDDELDEAPSADVGEYVDAIGGPGDARDLRRLTVPAGVALRVAITSSDSAPFVRLLDNGGNVLAGQHRRSLALSEVETDTVCYVDVRSGGGPVEYSLDIRRIEQNDGDRVPGLARTSPIEGRIQWRTDPRDVFSVYARKNDLIYASLRRPSFSDCQVRIREPGVEVSEPPAAASVGAETREFVVFRAQTTGVHSLEVNAADGYGPYTLWYRVMPPHPDDAPPGIPIGSTRAGQLHWLRDPRDVYSLYLPPGRAVRVTLDGHSRTDFDLRLSYVAADGSRSRASLKNSYPDSVFLRAPSSGPGITVRVAVTAPRRVSGYGWYRLTTVRY